MNMRHLHLLMSIACAMLFIVSATAQTPRLLGREDRPNSGIKRNSSFKTDKDSIDPNSIPKGLMVWTIDERFGSVQPTEPDTLSHLFQNSNFTEGVRGTYNFLGTLGAPRVSRIYSGEMDYMMGSQFIFTLPYSYYLRPINQMVFTNTKSPIAHLTYHSAGGKQTGDDRFIADFSTNINKRAGIGFVIDYAYGRGNYKNQPNSAFGGTVYGSYRGDQYQMYTFFNSNHLKTVENGGLEDDAYIVNPESFPTRYQSIDIPVRLQGVRNTLNVNRLFLSHRYSVGFYEYVDSLGRVVHQTMRSTALIPMAAAAGDTLQSSLTSTSGFVADTTLSRRFVPVASLIHTFSLAHNNRLFSSQQKQDAFFQNFYYTADKAHDKTRYLSLQNTIALEMQEGFRSWVKTGMRLFAKHELARFTLPNVAQQEETTTFNYITLGAQLMREKAQTLRYNVLGEMRTTGRNWGEFNLEGRIGLHFRLGSDTLSLQARGFVRNENPAFYYEHFHSRNAWWDKSLNKIFRFRTEGKLVYGSTRLGVGLETIQNHVFLQETQTAATPAAQATMKYGVDVQQTSTNIQLLSATLGKDFRFGILNWENELTLQKSSSDRTLPLPLLTVWSNLYLKFKIARVLATELGADVRYFTHYYAPTYSPMVGMYALQDTNYRTKLGNYPWLNAYANFTLKGVRFYVAYAHLNQGNGHYFLAPHYPTNPAELRVGISWTFFN